MNKYYFTFGQSHAHRYGNVTLDKNCVVLIEADDVDSARKRMFDTFGQKWASQYNDKPDMKFYPRGVIKL